MSWLQQPQRFYIPYSVFNISSLQAISLGYNNLFGSLSSHIFDYLPRLYYLNLEFCQLSGRVPMSLFKCRELNFLFLDNNYLEGIVPIEISNLTSLKYISIERNYLSGKIPSVVGNLTFLEEFELSENNLTGQIPSSLCNLGSLKVLFLYKNSLDGEIPECTGNMSSLSHIDLEKNNFHGKIPENFVRGCSLHSFRISSNRVQGSLPRSLGNCKELKLLDVGNNYLNDTFPNWLGNLDQLQVLILRSNRFYGEVVSTGLTVCFTRLRLVDISHNNFSGYLPVKFFENLHAIREGNEKKEKPEYMTDGSAVGVWNYAIGLSFTFKGSEFEFYELLTIWTAIDFSSNRFYGEIPKTLGELHSLIVLNLSHNCLTGPIPSSLGDISELESLDLSSNKLHGRIPIELNNLRFLAVLNLSTNNLTGTIPQGKQFDTFANDSYIGNSGLCGLPLSKSCNNDEGTPAKFDRDDDGLNWKFSILMGYGCGLVLGLSTEYIVFATGRPLWFIRFYERVRQRLAKKVKKRSS
ncbi:receptor-like protein 9DC3 [Hibiscus syriacus]|uniref:receptor-like protein 9DC3 n=1 Tax=Hibiscus syriacus TaxID=106335 RepID=UPI001923FDF2|nr:receptor-like protein 9DC3 [Hibiscus syriacus]